MPRWASRRPRWSTATRSCRSASTFIHERIGTPAIAEQYIEGREIYVGVLGNDRLRVLPIWELQFGSIPEGAHRIATEQRQARHALPGQASASSTARPRTCAPELQARIVKLVKRICRTLDLDGYARIDFRLAADGTPYFIEANPNPEIAQIEEFAQAAKHDGLPYAELLNRIVALGINRAKTVGRFRLMPRRLVAFRARDML